VDGLNMRAYDYVREQKFLRLLKDHFGIPGQADHPGLPLHTEGRRKCNRIDFYTLPEI
jgi:hypothetical protein